MSEEKNFIKFLLLIVLVYLLGKFYVVIEGMNVIVGGSL